MSEAKHYCPEKLKPGGCTLHNLHCGYPACDRAPASPLPEVAEPVAKLIGWRTDDYLMETNDPKLARNWEPHHKLLPIFAGDPNTKLAAPSPVAQAPAQAGEVGAFEDWWYGHDGVRQRQVAYLGWPCTKELAESIWNGAREQAASSLPVALQQAREALAYHQAQTRPIDKTVDAIKAIDAALATPPAHPVLATVVREPLTDEQLHKVLDKAFRQAALDGTWRPGREQSVIAARAIERAHGIQATTGEQSHG